jgi:hypothetical protein
MFRSASERLIATFRAFELQHRFEPFLRPLARTPVHPIAVTSRFRKVSKACRNKASSRRKNVTIALRILAMSEEALRHDETQIVFRAGHGDVEQPSLLLYLRGGSGTKIGGYAAVNS